ncbi:MAG: adenosine kinase [Hyphomicrobiaceae bacterium]|nr:adenosine kinase [Hyphomicrobiaceae bacterium]MCC0007422.1 adenosine kinase [Hyphomicrobiaceae bacterium]
MSEIRHDVVGIGNAIVDILGRCDDAFLAEHGAPKGHMRLVDDATISTLYGAMGPAVEISGGSAANTLVGIASLGGRAAFIGKVADDEFGRIFAHDIEAAAVAFSTPPVAGKAPTSRSLILVTPDGERTMNTFLGISTDLDGGEIDAAVIRSSAIVYLEGYLFDRDDAKAAFREAVRIAKSAGRRVALSLSDSFCVDRHRAEFIDLIRNGVDILFANESEIISLYETADFEIAAANAARDTSLAALTRSAKGSVILSEGRRLEIPVEAVEKVVDSTGAGDLYAAGFLYGLSAGLGLETAGKLGSLAAAEVITHMGARPNTPLHQLARARGLLS